VYVARMSDIKFTVEEFADGFSYIMKYFFLDDHGQPCMQSKRELCIEHFFPFHIHFSLHM